MSEDLGRAVALGQWVQDRTSTRVEPFRWGAAVFNDDLPQRYFSNFVRVERPLLGAEAAELVRETDQALAGLQHRQIQVLGDEDGVRLAGDLSAVGYDAEHFATLAWRHDPGPGPGVDLVEELAFRQVRPFLVEVYRRALPDRQEALAELFADFRARVQERVGARFFARRADGQVASLCELYVHDGAAQVEHVDTLAELRGRGFAGSVVLRAASAARLAGADLVCIDADVDDLAIGLYRRLGFAEIGRSWAFTRPPGAALGRGDTAPGYGPPRIP